MPSGGNSISVRHRGIRIHGVKAGGSRFSRNIMAPQSFICGAALQMDVRPPEPAHT